ncbi:MAG: IMPACT family protein [Candidatus Caldatribacteriaceae bacterium]
MLSVENETRLEIVVERSRFIALSFRVRNREEAREKIHFVQSLFPGATHYPYAWRLKEGKEEFFSDSGEPPGSAGKPILGALRRIGASNAMVVVVRYFGGKKLGIRGLIEAYGNAAQGVLQKGGLKECQSEHLFLVTANLPHFNWVVNRLLSVRGDKERLLLQGGGKISFLVPESDRQKVEEILLKGQKEGKILQFEEKEV